MELRREHVSAFHGGVDHHAVFRCRGDKLPVRCMKEIRMYKIDVGIFPDSLEQAALGIDIETVPAHVRDFQTLAVRDARDAALINAQTFRFGTLPARGEQQLHAETDAQKRLAACDIFLDRVLDAVFVETVHRIAEGADARKNRAVRFQDFIFISCYKAVASDVRQRLGDALDIACAVIDYRNHFINSVSDCFILPYSHFFCNKNSATTSKIRIDFQK